MKGCYIETPGAGTCPYMSKTREEVMADPAQEKPVFEPSEIMRCSKRYYQKEIEY